MEEKKEAYDEAVEQISEYQTKIDNNDYYVECAIDEKKAAVDAATTALAQAQDTLTQAQNSDNSASQAVSTDLTYIKAQIEAGADSDTLLSVVQQAMDDYTTRVHSNRHRRNLTPRSKLTIKMWKKPTLKLRN